MPIKPRLARLERQRQARALPPYRADRLEELTAAGRDASRWLEARYGLAPGALDRPLPPADPAAQARLDAMRALWEEYQATDESWAYSDWCLDRWLRGLWPPR